MSTEFKEYISNFDGITRLRLEHIYELIKKLLPDSQEKISYGIPTFFNENGMIVYFAGYKDFVSIYPVHLTNLEAELIKPYLHGKSTARFENNKELPEELIGKVVTGLLQANLERSKKK